MGLNALSGIRNILKAPMKIEYIDHMGSDLSVVNAARVSFDKESEASDWHTVQIGNRTVCVPLIGDSDFRLIHYLAGHGHWSPFAHAFVSLRWKAPIFVARQLVKHQVGLSWNEVSRRYVKTEPELYWPEKWRKSAESVKQGSSDEEFVDKYNNLYYAQITADELTRYYRGLLTQGLCPEQARMFLPLNTYTEWIWSGSLYAWARVYKQRTDPTAQQETRQLVLTLDDICGKLYPVSWKVLTKGE